MNELNVFTPFKEFSLFECGKEECIKEKTITLTKKSHHLFHYVYSGKGVLILNGKTYQLSKGMIFFIPKNTDAVYYSKKEDPWFYEWVGFGGEVADKYLEKLDININNPIIIDQKKNYRTYFDGIVQRYVNNGEMDLYALGSLFQLFGDMLFEKSGRPNVNNTRVTIQLAKDYIHNNYQFNITIKDIAKNANVTPNHLSALFQKSEKMSTKAYLIKIRMERAVILLETGEFKIKEVSKMVGYTNQLHFSNEFSKYYGKSPINYIKRHK